MNTVIRGSALLLSALLCSTVLAQTPNSPSSHDNGQYRLSGIITIDEDRSIAIIESPKGEFIMVHRGDEFDGGRVLEISNKSMRVHYADRDRRFLLTSSGFTVAADQLPFVLSKVDKGNILIRTLAKDPVVSRLDELIAAGPAKAGSLQTMLSPLLELPKETRIVGINDHMPLGSEAESMTVLRASLAHGQPVRLILDGNSGKQMVYLMTKAEGSSGQVE